MSEKELLAEEILSVQTMLADQHEMTEETTTKQVIELALDRIARALKLMNVTY